MARQRRFTTSITLAGPSVPNELPFEQLSRMLALIKLGSDAQSTSWSVAPALHLSLPTNDNTLHKESLLAVPSPIQASLSQDLAIKFNDQMLPHLQALFPKSAINGLMLEASVGAVDLNRYSSAQVQFLIYAATNNLPGISQDIPLTSICDYLRDPVRVYLKGNSNQLSTRSLESLLPCTKPMAETMFRCAVEAGDHALVQQLLTHQELGLDASNHICTINDVPWTAIERAAALSHTRLAEVLISMGVDVNKTHRSDRSGPGMDDFYGSLGTCDGVVPCGALEHAIEARRSRSCASLDMIVLLLQAGGYFRPALLNGVLRLGDAQAAHLLVSARIQIAHQSWLGSGCLHGIIHRLDQETVIDICDEFHAVGIDFNYDLIEEEDSTPVWDIPPTPPRLVDIAIERGFVEAVVRLRGFGATFGHDTMTAAVRSSNQMLVHYLLKLGAVADCYSTHFRTTPIAEAVRLRQVEIYKLFVGEGCMRQIRQENRFCSMLASAAGSGDALMLDFLLGLKISHANDPRILGYALAKAAEANHTIAAMKLADAGASLDGRMCSSVLGHTTSMYISYMCERQHNPMACALEHQNTELFEKLFEHCPDIYADHLPLLAIQSGNMEVLESLISVGASMAQACKFAVEIGDLSGVRHLHSRGAVISMQMEEQDDLLCTAIGRADTTMALELLSYGIKPSPNALVAAVTTEHLLVETLLRVHLTAEQGRPDQSSIVTAAAYNIHRYGQGWLFDSLPGLPSGIRWITPLGAAILRYNGANLETTRRLLQTNPDMDRSAVAHYNHGDPYNIGVLETVLLLAVGTCEPPLVRLLLLHGADVNLSARKGRRRTPLQKAAEVGAWPVVKLLLDHGADFNAPPAERDGGTAVQLAARGGYIGIVELLLDAGADIQAVGSKVHGRTALESAAEDGRYDMVKFLTSRTEYSDTQCEKAVAYARGKSHNAVADLLLTIRAEHRTQVLAIQRLTCVDCNALLSNAFTLKRHRQTAHGYAVGVPRHTCRICSRVFKRKDMMDRHVEAHEGSGRVECTRCGKHFSRVDSLSSHLRHCGQDQM
ncbi:hypothetical protein LTR97_011438 [Elasticomyces elasticus]|uniref:C2H2-type domain-containing protein n=1 Tax=Elasticomyces elasticus TaxID=574655 RepID=A0AAN7ZZT5_9PEZI|nr:hypothetical protein LTR97_011438 [Elasticomyces elasticus]